jgi:CubicO group peptidase (beta-lactamase class C family)
MTRRLPLSILAAGLLLIAAAPVACTSAPATENAETQPSAEMSDLLDYVRDHRSTGFLVIENGKTLISKTWRAPEGDTAFANFTYGAAADGSLLEDVASQQKSFVAVLAAIAIDKGLLDVDKPVSAYLGQGWSKAAPEQEAAIRVIDVLTMSSGLDEGFRYKAPAGSTFFYNTPVYAALKPILAKAAGQPLESLSHDWLTAPAGMADTAWRKRPAALASVGNDTGLVTTPADVGRFGQMILHKGVAENGTRIVSEAQVAAMFARSSANPSYGRLWWLNGADYSVRIAGGRKDGPLVPAAPADMVGAYGAFDRRLYIVPGRNLVVVRTGAATNEQDFDQQLWLKLARVLD